MLDTSYAERRETVFRVRRVHEDIDRIISDPNISAVAASLLIWMLGRPQKWRFMVAHIVTIRNADGKPRWGARDRVRKLLGELIEAGYVTIEREGREGGGFEAGIYLVSDRRRWARAVDICDAENLAETGELGDSQAETTAPCFTSLRIYNSRNNTDIPTGADRGKSVPPCQQPDAETRQGGSKAGLTGKAEPRGRAACRLPQPERRSRAASGSAGQKLGCSGGKKSDGTQAEIQNIEQTRAQLVAAGGSALADAYTTPGLWRLTEVIVWLTLGYDLSLDVLPTIRDVSTRAGVEPGQVRSWRYYTAAIRDGNARRRGVAPPRSPGKYAPRLDPYAPAPRDPDAWGQVFLAAAIGGRRP